MSKTRETTAKVILTLTLGIMALFFVLLTPQEAFAAAYGTGTYGTGTYGGGSYNTGTTPAPRSFSPALAPDCTDPKPLSAPDLFQIDAKPESLVLYFSPAIGPQDRYAVVYGLEPDQELWAYEFLNRSNGVISVEIGKLKRNTRYFFKVRAGNGCMPGDWSNTLSATTGQPLPSYKWNWTPNFSSNTRAGKTSATPALVKKEISTPTPSPMPQSSPTQKATQEPKAPQDISMPDSQQETNEEPSFWERVINFFKRLFS